MARKKVKLAWISNDATRRATLKKRRKGLMKKMNELSILCDVRACAIIYSPNEPEPEAWPSVQEATRILSRFRAMPEIERCKNMMNRDGFFRQRVSKLHDRLRRQHRVNRELESAALLRECMAGAAIDNLCIEELAALAWILEQKTKGVQDRIDHLRFLIPQPQPSQLPMLFPKSYYPEDVRWLTNGGESSIAAAGDFSYQQMDQMGGVGEGSGGVPAGDNVLFVEQNQGNWESFLPY